MVAVKEGDWSKFDVRGEWDGSQSFQAFDVIGAWAATVPQGALSSCFITLTLFLFDNSKSRRLTGESFLSLALQLAPSPPPPASESFRPVVYYLF